MLNDGDKCICQHDDWWNAFGDKSEALQTGMRLTVAGSRRIGGLSFLTFKEVQDGNYYMADGFKPMRALN